MASPNSVVSHKERKFRKQSDNNFKKRKKSKLLCSFTFRHPQQEGLKTHKWQRQLGVWSITFPASTGRVLSPVRGQFLCRGCQNLQFVPKGGEPHGARPPLTERAIKPRGPAWPESRGLPGRRDTWCPTTLMKASTWSTLADTPHIPSFWP